MRRLSPSLPPAGPEKEDMSNKRVDPAPSEHEWDWVDDGDQPRSRWSF